jgi:hypothetical protein
MPIDLGNAPTGTPPTAEEKTQILSALGIPDVSTRSGAENLSNKTLVSPAFSGTATGQLELPTQASSSANSVMTRNLHEQEFHQNFWAPINWVTPTATANASGSVSGQNAVLGVTVSAVTGNNVYTSDFDSIFANSGSGSNNRFSGANFTMCFDAQCNVFSNNEIRLLYGVTNSTTSLAAAGFAVVWTSSTTLKLQIHNGTTLQESPSLTIPSLSINNFHRYMVVWSGSTLTLYNKQWAPTGVQTRWSLIGSFTGTSLPTTTSGTKIVASSVAIGAGANNSNFRIRSFYVAPFVATI